jgi:hypothetical protein
LKTLLDMTSAMEILKSASWRHSTRTELVSAWARHRQFPYLIIHLDAEPAGERILIRNEEEEARFVAGEIPGVCFAHGPVWVPDCVLHLKFHLCLGTDTRILTLDGEDVTAALPLEGPAVERVRRLQKRYEDEGQQQRCSCDWRGKPLPQTESCAW